MRIGRELLCLFLTALPCVAQAATLRGVLPVAGSVHGAFGSSFKTSLQLNNRTDVPQSGVLVFHPAGQSAADTDPRLTYALGPHQTVSYDDVVDAMGTSGLGSIDVLVDVGAVPAIVARAFDDEGTLGTTGAGIRAVSPEAAAKSGATTTLVAPGDLDRFRFNIGVRSLEGGATLKATIYASSGSVRNIVDGLVFPASYFVQRPAAEFLGGLTLAPNDSIEFEVVSGAAILYGTTTDNTTNDPAIQLAQEAN